MLVRLLLIAGVGLALCLTGCSSPSDPYALSVDDWPAVASASFEATEDVSARDAMWAHALEVWPQVQAGIGDPAASPHIKRSVAQSSEIVTAYPVWDYNPRRLPDASASVWLGLMQDGRRPYLIPVVSGGKPVMTLRSHRISRWTVFPDITNHAAQIETALGLLDRRFGNRDYEWRFVSSFYGYFVLARTDKAVAGVYVDPTWPVFDDGPDGVLDGDRLRWWLDHPRGPETR